MNWQASSCLLSHDLAASGVEQAQLATAAEYNGARMLHWSILLDLSTSFGLDTVIGPSFFEAHPYLKSIPATKPDLYVTASRPVVTLDWIRPEDHLALIHSFSNDLHALFIGRPKFMQEESADALEEAFISVPFQTADPITYQQDWWRTGNKALIRSQPLTIWGVSLDALPSFTHTGSPPVPLTAPEETLHKVYFDHTPSGPFRCRGGDHVWTDGSKCVINSIHIAGAGLVGLVRTS